MKNTSLMVLQHEEVEPAGIIEKLASIAGIPYGVELLYETNESTMHLFDPSPCPGWIDERER